MKIDSSASQPWFNLMRLHQRLGRSEEYLKCLRRLASRNDAKPEWIQELGDYYLSLGNFKKAGKAYKRALDAGLDSAYVISQRAKYPGLGK